MTNEIAIYLLQLIGSILGIIATVYFYGKYKSIKDDELRVIIDNAVEAAEQVFGSGQGSLKKSYVIKKLTEMGVKAGAELIEILIESAVYKLTK